MFGSEISWYSREDRKHGFMCQPNMIFEKYFVGLMLNKKRKKILVNCICLFFFKLYLYSQYHKYQICHKGFCVLYCSQLGTNSHRHTLKSCGKPSQNALFRYWIKHFFRTVSFKEPLSPAGHLTNINGKWLHSYSTFIQSDLHFFFAFHSPTCTDSHTLMAVNYHATAWPHHSV